MECAMTGDVERFVQCNEAVEAADPSGHDQVTVLVNTRGSEDGRSALDWTAVLGNTAMLAQLLAHGALINDVTDKGYTALHHATAWGQLDCVKLLVDSGADLLLRNVFNEKARDVAARYRIYPCIEYLDWAEARQSVRDLLISLKEQLAPDKLKVLSKDDKLMVSSLLAEKSAWVDSLSLDVEAVDILTEKQSLENSLAPIIHRINEPPENKHGKGGRKAR